MPTTNSEDRDNQLFLILHSPKEMPSSEDRLTKSLSRIIPHEVHISPYL